MRLPSNSVALSAKQTKARRIVPDQRKGIVSTIWTEDRVGVRQSKVLLIGDGGIGCYELGEVRGVCAEAPLPRISVFEERSSLDGVCGIASMLRRWGLAPVVSCPLGAGGTSLLQEELLSKAGLPKIRLQTGQPQVTRHTRRIFAGGHQLAHIETDEKIQPATASMVRRGMQTLMSNLRGTDLLCLVDNGNAGLNTESLVELIDCAKRCNSRMLYEPRTANLLTNCCFDIVKVNHNQIKQWFGVAVETDREALAASERVLASSGANIVICTRGERGIVVRLRSGAGRESYLVAPQPKGLFDLVSAGDVVTAALAFCFAKKCSPLQAACFAATAAELSLDRRYEKHVDIKSILNYDVQSSL